MKSGARLARNMSGDVSKRIELALERIRPALEMDGGDVRLVSWDADAGHVKVELSGACSGCSNVTSTMTLGVERVLKQLVPEIRHVESVERA